MKPSSGRKILRRRLSGLFLFRNCGPEADRMGEKSRPDVILILLDSVRPDALGA
jgi:hypothetical protein